MHTPRSIRRACEHTGLAHILRLPMRAGLQTTAALRASDVDWDPTQYLRFADHRARPGLELLSRINHPRPHTVVDLGCGPGILTARLAERWPHAHVTGVDSSPSMLSKAALAHPHRHISWQQVMLSPLLYLNTSVGALQCVGDLVCFGSNFSGHAIATSDCEHANVAAG